MPIDPSIPLSADTGGLDIGKMVSLGQLAQKMRLQDQAAQSTNMLKQVFAHPEALDPAGNPTPKTLQAVMSIDPQAGMDLRASTLDSQVKQAQAEHYKTEMGKNRFDFLSGAAGIGTDAYESAKKLGKSEPDAVSAAMQARNEAIRNNGGVLSETDMDAISATPFDPMQARVFAMANPGYATRQEKAKTEGIQERGIAERERHDAALENVAAGKGANAGWELFNTPDGKTVRVNKATGETAPVDTEKLTKVGPDKSDAGKFTPEMGSLMGALAERGVSLPAGLRAKAQQIQLYQGILDRNPGKTPDQIADLIKTGQIELGAQKKETQTAAGVAGKVEVFANELDAQLPLLRAAAKAVPRGEWTDLTKLLQTGDEHISNPALKTLKGYITSTINAYDALAARGGTDKGKREENRKTLLASDGPEAFEAQLKVFENEAKIAKKAAFDATKAPELDAPKGTDKPGWKIEEVK